eukprot:gene7967-10201_t
MAADEASRSGGLCVSRQRPSDKEKLALKYFLRLLVQDASGSDYWNTVEATLYRSTIPASAPLKLSDVDLDVRV